MRRTEHAVKNAFWGILLVAITTIAPFVIRMIVIRTIGKEFLGVSGVFGSIWSMLSLAELGFSNAIAYKCYGFYARGDFESLGRYLSFFRNVYRVVGITIVFVGLALTPYLKYIVREPLPAELNMYIIYFAYLAHTSVSYFLAAYRTVILTVSQRQDIESTIALCCHSAMYAIQILVLCLLKNYYIYLIVLPCCTVLINVVRAIVTKKKFPDIIPSGNISEEERKEVFKSIVPLIGHKIKGTIVVSADNIVISVFLGVVSVTIYNNYWLILNSIIAVISAVYAAIKPGIGNSMAIESAEKNYIDFKRFSFLINWIVGWASIGFFCAVSDLVNVAFGADVMLGDSAIFLLAIELYLWKTFEIITIYRDVVGKWAGDAIIPYISGLFNLMCNILLVKHIGLNGVIISTILSFIIFDVPFSLRVLFKKTFGKPVITFIREYIGEFVVLMIIGLITYEICKCVKIEFLLLRLLVKICICVVLPNVLFTVVFLKNENIKYLGRVIADSPIGKHIIGMIKVNKN